MDHLPLGDDANVITVPYIAKATFGGEDFSSYPQRRGYDFWALRKRPDASKPYAFLDALMRDRSLNSLAEFVQSWLFFGLLQSCLAPKPKVSDYIRKRTLGTSVITLKHLHHDLAAWKRTVCSESKKRWSGRAIAVRDCLNSAVTAILLLDWSAGSAAARKPGNKSVAALQEQLFVCWSLLTAISNAEGKIFGTGQSSHQPSSTSTTGHMMSWMDTKFKQARWCPHTINHLKMQFSMDLQMYAYSLGSVRCQKDHSRCSVGHCNADRLQKVEAPRHIGDCSQDCESVGPPVGEIVRILRSGQIPVVFLEADGNDAKSIRLTVDAAKPGDRYVAISHVWSDGLANPKANELPSCQLLALHQTLHRVEPYRSVEQRSQTPIWFDALCIPVDKQYQSLRSFSINNMYRIYRDAWTVLAFDPEVPKLRSTTSVQEVLTRTLFSGGANDSGHSKKEQEGAAISS